MHWGIWIGNENCWMCFDSGNLFWTTSCAVAEAQLRQSRFVGREDVVVLAFDAPSSANEQNANIDDGGNRNRRS
jgi:hypothetical protein